LVVREVAGAVSGVACFWATSLEKIFGGVIAIITGSSPTLKMMGMAVYRLVGVYTGRILKGEQPRFAGGAADEVRVRHQSHDRENSLNIPDKLIALADEVIE
jgi:hypothetical protein